MAITLEYSNSVDRTIENLAAQRAEQERWTRDFADGQRRFWKGDSLIYCANDVERAGYWDAAETAHREAVLEREHAAFVLALRPITHAHAGPRKAA